MRPGWVIVWALAGVIACREAPRSPRQDAEALTSEAKRLVGAQRKDTLERAIGVYERALARWEQVGDLVKQAEIAGELGDVWDNLGDMTKARAWSARSLELYRRAGDRHGEAMALSWVGIAEVHLDRPRDAIAKFEQARDLARANGDDEGYAYALLNLGYAHNELEEWREAEAALLAALPIFERLGDRVSVATCHNNLGNQRKSLGDAAGALAEHERALAIRIADQRKLDVGWSQVSIGIVYLDLLGDAAAALPRFRAAQAIWTEVGNDVGVPIALTRIARAQAALGELAAAVATFDEAIVRYRAIKSERGVAEALVHRAVVLARLGRPEAEAALTDGLARAVAVELPTFQIRALLELARLAAARRDLAGARATVERGVALIEGLRAKVLREEHRRSFFATVQDSFELAITLALDAGDVAGAFAASERARARTLVEALAEHPRPLPVDAATARALLGDDTVLASFVLGEPTSHAFVLAAAGIRAVELPGRARIEALAHALLAQVQRPPTGAREVSSRALAEALVAPLRLDARRVVIVADGALHFVPFAELAGLREREVVRLPSATTLAELRRRAPAPVHGLDLAILADPIFASDDPRVTAPRSPAAGTLARLRYSRREADGIAALVPPARRLIALDGAAALDTVRGPAIATARIVHFATHALIDAERPERSAIMLSTVDPSGADQGGALRLTDLAQLRWSADLVVISGCRSALGPEVRGEGMVGLVGGFLRAGARRVVASLWEVDDRATSELMIRFHANLATQPASAALAAAQRAIATTPAWRDPYYWAGFALYGDWQ